MRRRAVITGLGPVSAIGTGVEPFWDALVAGRSGTRTLTRCRPPPQGCAVAAEVDDPPPAPIEPHSPMPRGVMLALAAARLALEDAGLNGDRERMGVAVGTGAGNLELIEVVLAEMLRGARLAPAMAFRAYAHAAACEILRAFDLRGPVITLTSGCNSGVDALGCALDWIRLGRADAVLVGGTEAELNSSFLAMMAAARALSTKHNARPETASRPFDVERDGNVPGEGAGFLVVEAEQHAARRGARARAELAGYASTAVGDRPPYDPANPAFRPDAMARNLRAALRDAGIVPAQVSAVSANGSSSVFYDTFEAAALELLFGAALPEVPVHSVKGALGQTGAGTPALQAIAATLSVERGLLPPTINVARLDPKCSLALVREPLRRPLDHLLLNATGFGGYYFSALVIGRA